MLHPHSLSNTHTHTHTHTFLFQQCKYWWERRFWRILTIYYTNTLQKKNKKKWSIKCPQNKTTTTPNNNNNNNKTTKTTTNKQNSNQKSHTQKCTLQFKGKTVSPCAHGLAETLLTTEMGVGWDKKWVTCIIITIIMSPWVHAFHTCVKNNPKQNT